MKVTFAILVVACLGLASPVCGSVTINSMSLSVAGGVSGPGLTGRTEDVSVDARTSPLPLTGVAAASDDLGLTNNFAVTSAELDSSIGFGVIANSVTISGSIQIELGDLPNDSIIPTAGAFLNTRFTIDTEYSYTLQAQLDSPYAADNQSIALFLLPPGGGRAVFTGETSTFSQSGTLAPEEDYVLMLGSGAGRDQGTLRMTYQLTLTPVDTPVDTPTDNAVPEPATVIIFALIGPLILWRRHQSLRIN